MSCANCGVVQTAAGRPHGALECGVCRSEMERTTGRSLSAALACSSAVLLLLIPANLLPFMTTTVLGAVRHSYLLSSVTTMWNQGWPLLGVTIAVFIVFAPLVRFALLTLVLTQLRFRRSRPAWLAPAFRIADGLQSFAMADVFLLGLWVAYARLAATISVSIEAGAKCFIIAGVLTLFARATTDKRAIWRLIGTQPLLEPGEPTLACETCALVLPAEREGTRCPRCRTRLHCRKPEAAGRAAALTLAALIMYIPANVYPIATLPIGLVPTRYTVIQGVFDLAQAGLWDLALLVFTASFAIPFLKLAGLTWCIVSIVRRSRKRLVFKTRLYRVIEEAGRWSMVDPFVIACFVPITQYNAVIFSRAEPAAPAFTAVVVLTILAARAFDPRQMWDAARMGA